MQKYKNRGFVKWDLNNLTRKASSPLFTNQACGNILILSEGLDDLAYAWWKEQNKG